ncbi:MAG: ankyrin repeat domain-containing protein, partial [Moraxellaceae bacterium]
MLLHKYVHLYGFSVRFFSTKYIMDALLAAVSRGDSPAALQLIKKRAYNPQAVYADGRNALQLACYSNMTDVANKLIDSGKFALNTVDPDGSLLLMIACMNRMESTAAKLVSTDNGHLDATGNTALMVACGANLPTIAIALLKRSRPIGLNVINKNGVNALLIAAGKKLADVCLLLIDLGADVSQVSTGGGNTALILAAKGGLGMDAVVAKLLDKGANAASVNALGESALFWAASTNAHNIKRLITPQTINQAQTSTGNTPLIVACLSLNTDAAMAVLESPIVDPALANKRGQTAETIAVSQGLRPVVERLIRGTTVAINADKTVSDFVNQEDVNIRSYLAASNDHIIFTIDATNHMFASSRGAILRDFDTKVRYRCHVADTLRPENVDLSLPLYSMRQIGVMVDFCLADDMRAI